MKIAFFVNDFPVVSETFILNQMVALLQRGHDIRIYALAERTDNVRHADIERYQLLDRIQYRTPSHSRLARLRSVAARIIRWGWRDPRAARTA